MAQPLLVVRHRDTGALVFTLAGATPTQLGNPVPAPLDTVGDNALHMVTNRAIQFQGAVYSAFADGVYKLNAGTGVWSKATIDGGLTFATPTGASDSVQMPGLYYSVVSDVPTLYGFYPSGLANSADWRGFMLNGNTGIWSETPVQTLALAHTSGASWGTRTFVYRNILFAQINTGFVTFDPSSGSLGAVIPPVSYDYHQAAFCVFNDRLFSVAADTGTSNVSLWEFNGGAWTQILTTADTYDGSPVSGPRYALFTDGAAMYAIYHKNTPDLTVVRKFTDVLGVITDAGDVGGTVLPVGIRTQASVALTRWWVFHDQETTPGTDRILLYHALGGLPADTLNQYLWQGDATPLLFEDIGGAASWAFPEWQTGGGDRIFTIGELDIVITRRAATLGGERVYFRAYGDPGSANKNVEFRRNTQNEVPLALCTLTGGVTTSGPGALPVRVGNIITLVDADGVTEYSCVWNNTADGSASGSRAQLVPRVYT